MKKITDEQQKLLDLKAKEIENLGIEVKVPSTVLRKDLKISGKNGDLVKRRFNLFHKSCSPSRKSNKGWL